MDETHAFGNDRTAKTHHESALGWVLIGWVLGRSLCKTYGGGNVPERTLPKNFWTPPTELLVCSVVDFSTGKTEQ